ncbi:septum formation inhibitor Maf [Pseudomaricurvus alkylphenolicus]|uniref:Maf family protein n=1 Tax=Pseudomaricurvus alkylphenolicus TaxID=1306991 RepID=UPI001421BF64|nr:nucleoside triphosphate pyrophosphatase [Pseudomaricurvus alkylphenolicus]NIB41230.1 septum formation inhibitor Maf [Pseudomaricurvus alkylphenolicus]
MQPIVLASSSPYRRQLLSKLGLEFSAASPDIDESRLPKETPLQLVERLAKEKAQALAQTFPNHLIIGSDQVAALDREVVTKPGTHEAAVAQLRRASGRSLTFLTGVCLLNSHTDNFHVRIASYEVLFRKLSDQQIERYLQVEQPYDCAGSFKSEGLGISLFQYIRGDDPNTLVGLPLIELTDMLLNEGVDVLAGT